MVALRAAMARFRKNWSLPTRKSVTAARLARSRSARARCGNRARAKSEVAATFRWCISSPMASAWAIRARRPIPPEASTAPPQQPAEARFIVRAEAQDLAEPLVERAQAPVPEAAVLDDEERHSGGDDAGHGTHSGEVVARGEAGAPAV